MEVDCQLLILRNSDLDIQNTNYILKIIFALLLLIPIILITLSGTRFVGFVINRNFTSQFEYEGNYYYNSIGGILNFSIGIILLIFILRYIKSKISKFNITIEKSLKRLSPSYQQLLPQQQISAKNLFIASKIRTDKFISKKEDNILKDLDDKPDVSHYEFYYNDLKNLYICYIQKLPLIIIILCIIGIITLALFPFLKFDSHLYNDGEISMLSELFGRESTPLENLNENLHKIRWCFAISFLIGIITLIGTLIFRLRDTLFSHFLISLGCIIIILSILVIIYHIFAFKNIINIYDDAIFAGNVIPLLASFVLLRKSYLYIKTVYPVSIKNCIEFIVEFNTNHHSSQEIPSLQPLPSPPKQQTAIPLCSICEQRIRYINEYQKWYCDTCKRYI